MAMQSMPQIGQAVVVHGTVMVESSNGVNMVIQPNSPIYSDDRIDTGSDGALSIVFGDKAGTQLDLDRMTSMVIDDDVLDAALPDPGDVAVESGLVQDLLQTWEAFEPVAALETLIPDADFAGGEADTADNAGSEFVPGMDSAATDLADTDFGDDGGGAMDDDFDLTSLIPPPDDGA